MNDIEHIYVLQMHKKGEFKLPNEMSVENQLFAITTIINTEWSRNENCLQGQATGFFYNETTPLAANNINGHWERLDKFWLVTNRHVVLNHNDGSELLVDKFTFNLRRVINGHIEWLPITLLKDEFKNNLLLHLDSKIDVVVIDVSDYIIRAVDPRGESHTDIMIPATLTQDNLPNKQPITIEVTSDVVVASYPRGFYDTFNKFPIIKSGIIASGWNLNFNGDPVFQIDAQLFPGSSGGMVISKPSNISLHDGKVLYHKGSKQFVLLGVYSGEYTWPDYIDTGFSKIEQQHSYGLGNVWYSYLIPEIINAGVKYKE